MRTSAQKPNATRRTAFDQSANLTRARFGPSHEVNPILHLQRTIGNQAVQRLLSADGAGREAESDDAPPIVHQVLNSSGQSLDAATLAFFEPRFQCDLSHVRVHTDATAGESAQAVNARAYTVGRDVVFAAGNYAPDSEAGKSLLAHELTHVVQQGGGGQGPVSRQGSRLPALQRAPTFKECKTKDKGKEDAKEKVIAQAIADARPLTQGALDKLNVGIVRADTEANGAFQAHFGDPDDARVKAVVKVYEDIKSSLDGKEIVCLPKCEKSKKSEKADTCALAAPGKTISICPEFFRKPCADVQPSVILHEAAHNAGAGGNVDKDPAKTSAKKKQYPPKNGESNAYSYQYFAEDIQKGTFKPTSPGPGIKEREVKPTK